MKTLLLLCTIASNGLTFSMENTGDGYHMTGGCNHFRVSHGREGFRYSITRMGCSDPTEDKRVVDLLQKTARITEDSFWSDGGELLAKCNPSN